MEIKAPARLETFVRCKSQEDQDQRDSERFGVPDIHQDTFDFGPISRAEMREIVAEMLG